MASDGIYVDFMEMESLKQALEKIRRNLDPKKANRKLKRIASVASKPLKDEMRSIAPVHAKNPTYAGKNYYWYMKKRHKYKSGTLKKSVARWMGKTGVFVAPRIGRLNRRVLGIERLDGWYAHLAIKPHKKKGGGETQNHIAPAFIEKARLRKRLEVLNNMLTEANKVIAKNYR